MYVYFIDVDSLTEEPFESIKIDGFPFDIGQQISIKVENKDVNVWDIEESDKEYEIVEISTKIQINYNSRTKNEHFSVFVYVSEIIMTKYKTIEFFGKTSDMFSGTFTDENGNDIDFNDYPPSFIGSDGVNLSIDLATGQILNWIPPEDDDIDEYLGIEEEFED